MVASVTVRMATGTPNACAWRSSDSMRWRAIVRRRCVGATVIELIAQAGTARAPGTVSSVAHPLAVAIGVAGSADAASHTPDMRSLTRSLRRSSRPSASRTDPWNPRVTACSHESYALISLVSSSSKRSSRSASALALIASMGDLWMSKPMPATLSRASDSLMSYP